MEDTVLINTLIGSTSDNTLKLIARKDDWASTDMVSSSEKLDHGENSGNLDVPDVNRDNKMKEQPLEGGNNESETQSSGCGSAALPQYTEDQPQIVFIDPVGTRWTFPYEAAKTWSGVKKLIKSVFLDIYVPNRVSDLLDMETKGPTDNFSIIQIKPGSSKVLRSHWESLVLPGWEFKIEFTRVDILDCIREEKEDMERDSDKESVAPAEDINKIVYVAHYLTPDEDGDYRSSSTRRKEERVKPTEGSEIQIRKSVLEEYREVYFSNPHAINLDEMVDTIGIPVLYIHSPILLDALRAIIDFQSIPDKFTPKEFRAKSTISDLGLGRFVYPFVDLHHYQEKLLGYRKVVKESHDDEYHVVCVEHINILNEYLEGLTELGLKDAERLASGSVPKTTFTTLWLLLKPGSDVYVREKGKLNAYVIESFEGGIKWDSPSERSDPYTVDVWNLNFDGQYLTRSVKTITIPVFDNDREINSLPIFPVRFHVDEDPQNPLYQQLVDRGKRFVEVMRKPSFQEYNGPSKLQGIRTFNQARVVIDHQSLPWNSIDDPNAHTPCENFVGYELGERTRTARCPCQSCETKNPRKNGVERRVFDDYDDIDLSSRETLDDHQYLLCWSHVYGFVLKDRVWDVLEVSGLRDPKIDKDIIDSLVLKPDSNKYLIKAVCEIFGGTYPQTFSADFVRGKGEGQILLLHGPPGTGKTLTAESVAEYTGRPLLSITAADLGHEPERLESNLLRFFRNARKWNAIVLLDEADVYLETRSSQDLRRNSIVSIFLRALDYFEGLLFLTTNRVGSFDEAFMSRIHVQIGYDPLDDDSRRKIWEGYFKKLSKNHEDGGQLIRYNYDAKEYVRRERDLRVLKWNGREIRNAFQTAVALACFQAKHEGNSVPELTEDHLRQVVTMSHNFKSYLKAVRGAEEENAYLTRVRNDTTKASEGKVLS
ncbi:ATPase AAA-type core [Penicillium taxi]|uniref:ATPase AAA-type core n=1 Tax=Penicillium taxi TaxID=168475 RepID=UPI002545519D|nr:ATPase AAA-type core [Penicillium taxi]KAJ5884802.1 ATPase AAA-type core [Penicillium taxi]